jgi:deoxyribodipyrimidine photo-lyase
MTPARDSRTRTHDADGGRTAIVWFRRDLRIHDHPALVAAVARAQRVVPLFVVDDVLLRTDAAAAPDRVAFMLASLRALDASLAARGARLTIRRGDPARVVPAVAAEAGAREVHATRDQGRYGRARDTRVAAALAADGREFRGSPGLLIADPDEIRTATGGSYGVFAPFARRVAAHGVREVLSAPERIPGDLGPSAARAGLDSHAIPDLAELGLAPATARGVPEPGEDAARTRLDRWIAGGLVAYASTRDLVAVDGTSRLSQDLRWGLLSPVEVLARTRDAGAGGERFAAELAWREFYAHLLAADPRSATGAHGTDGPGIAWRHDPAGLDAWRAGRTGYPIVDAAMRQLAATGWMHGRARMVAASFLVKDLLVDWREGARHFMRTLVDGDPASNAGGWRWVAGSGAGAAPWFRVFNPVLQGMRFDPDGAYVRRWIPELAGVPTRFVHAPWTMPPDAAAAAGVRIGRDYPAPIVDHAEARRRALGARRRATGRGRGDGRRGRDGRGGRDGRAGAADAGRQPARRALSPGSHSTDAVAGGTRARKAPPSALSRSMSTAMSAASIGRAKM